MAKTLIGIHEPDWGWLVSVVNRMVTDPEWVAELGAHNSGVAERISWDVMRPVYTEVFETVVDGRIPPELFDPSLCRV